jgi:hypothetical protein
MLFGEIFAVCCENRTEHTDQPVNVLGETAAVYCEHRTEHTDTLCGQNAEF